MAVADSADRRPPMKVKKQPPASDGSAKAKFRPDKKRHGHTAVEAKGVAAPSRDKVELYDLTVACRAAQVALLTS